MPKIIEVYRKLKNRLMQAGIEESEAEARLILAEGLGISLGDVILYADRDCSYDPEGILQKRLTGMPLAYAMNRKYFMGLPFYVDSNVLIPRQDTEVLAEKALACIRQNGYHSVLDLCCGSGCIGISIEKLAEISVIGADISPAAVDIANKNAKSLGSQRFSAIQSDLFANIEDSFDMIVCNPPYVTEEEYALLEPGVRDYEPRIALIGGLAYYRAIVHEAGRYLKPRGMLLFEIGYAQKAGVEEILNLYHFKNIECLPDLAGRHRVIACTIS